MSTAWTTPVNSTLTHSVSFESSFSPGEDDICVLSDASIEAVAANSFMMLGGIVGINRFYMHTTRLLLQWKFLK